jgi:putative aminopeptidase FrvX
MVNQNTLLKHLEVLTQLPGIPNHEEKVKRYMREQCEPYADEIIQDALGSLFAIKKSKNKNAKKVMVAGHMDEVGFIVKDINKVGSIKIAPAGGWWTQVLMASPITLYTQDNQSFKGCIGSVAPHLLTPEKRNSVVEMEDLLVDIGLTSKEEAINHGIQVGDMIVLEGEYQPLVDGKRIMAKALDNRYGCAMAITLLEALKDIELPYDLYIGATVQEEVGLRGATTATSMIDPDIAIVFDCSPANDADGADDVLGKLGEGVLLRFADRSMLPNRCFLNRLKQTCVNHDIPYQYYLSLGGTDAGSIHKTNAGVPTLSLCIVARNIHTNHSILDVSDLEGAYKAAFALLNEFDGQAIEDMINCNQ